MRAFRRMAGLLGEIVVLAAVAYLLQSFVLRPELPLWWRMALILIPLLLALAGANLILRLIEGRGSKS